MNIVPPKCSGNSAGEKKV